jgi:hypothetical protein
VLVAEPLHVAMRQEGQMAVGERPDVAVQSVEMEAVEVGHVARDMKRHDLASAVAHYLGGGRRSFGHQEAAGGLIPLADDHLVRRDHRGLDVNAADGGPLVVDQIKRPLQPGQERMKGLQHRRLHARVAGAQACLSVAERPRRGRRC